MIKFHQFLLCYLRYLRAGLWGLVFYNMFLMSSNACSGAVTLTREISAHRLGSVSFKSETFRTPVSNVNHFTSRSSDVCLIFDRSLRLLNKINNGLLCFLSNQLQFLYFPFGWKRHK